MLNYVPNQFKTQEICDRAVKRESNKLSYVPDQYKCKYIYKRAAEALL